jgi:hypothetical protein
MLKIKVTSGTISVEMEVPITDRQQLGMKEDGTGFAILQVTEKLFEQIKKHKEL